ncbi:MAG: hypothetical protein KUG81_06655, partial [Gammaproteobacteria bacterium]|nr:hypothetical protein [Gammaproteobacteria bacterium]
YHSATSPNNIIRIEKTESEMNQQELDLFYGDLVNAWNKTPPKLQAKFINNKAEKIIDYIQDRFDDQSLDVSFDFSQMLEDFNEKQQ